MSRTPHQLGDAPANGTEPGAPVFIVGAGPSGLAAGWRLRKLGVPAVLLEARDRVGGQVNTRREAGYLMEEGATILPSAYTAVMDLVSEAEITGAAQYRRLDRRLRSRRRDPRPAL